jgi:hypothetical protein
MPVVRYAETRGHVADASWYLEPTWWDPQEVIHLGSLEHVGEGIWDMSYERVMPRNEVLELHRRFPLRENSGHLAERSKQLERLLTGLGMPEFVRVQVFEWSSGMG